MDCNNHYERKFAMIDKYPFNYIEQFPGDSHNGLTTPQQMYPYTNQDFFTQTSNYQRCYGYGYSAPDSVIGLLQTPIKEVTVNYNSFKFDHSIMMHYYEEYSSKGKIKKTLIVNDITITSITCINPKRDGKWEAIVVYYIVDGKRRYTIIKYAEFFKNSLYTLFPGLRKHPGCSDKLTRDLLIHLISNVRIVDNMNVFKRQGWNIIGTDELIFAVNSGPNVIFVDLITDSVKNRGMFPPQRPLENLNKDLVELLPKGCWKYKPLMLLSVASLLLIFFEEIGINPEQIFIFESSKYANEKMLAAFLKTKDYDSLITIPLDTDIKVTKQEIDDANDSVALFNDESCIDEEKKISDQFKYFLKDIRHENGIMDHSRHIIAVISRNAAYTARRILGDRACVLSFDEVGINCNPDRLHRLMGELAGYIINFIMNNSLAVREFFNTKIADIHQGIHENIPDKSINTFILIIMAHHFLLRFFNFCVLTREDTENITKWLNDDCEQGLSKELTIQNEFANIVSEHIRNGMFHVIKKERYTTFESGTKTLVVMGNNICFEPEIINNEIVPAMTTVKSRDSLIKALRTCGSLYATDNTSQPLDMLEPQGKHIRIYMYSVSINILDYDIIQKLHNLASEAYLLSDSEKPERDFITFINDGSGRSAGKQVRYRDEENNHVYITGQSGYGKTYLMDQLIAKCSELGHNLVVFDSSDSFTYESLCRNLPKRFVDENIEFIDLDSNGIPVDLFKIDRSVSLPSQKKQLVGILTAGIGELSAPQSNLLRSTLSELLSMLGQGEAIRTEDILTLLREGDSSTHESLLNRLEPLFEDIDACGMADSSWRKLMKSSGKIVVIRTDPAYTECGNQLIDMLLATLYNYQHDNPHISLDVFIDEIQNQNFSKQSPIRKIMKEGRKIHLSFFGATQDYYPRNTELGSVMSKADTQIFLRPTPNSESVVASELRFNKADMERFDSMQRGDIIVKGSLYNKEQRRNIPTTLSGHVDDYPKSQYNYYGNVR